MKSVIVYYSYSGNTRKVAEVLAEHLRKKTEIDMVELKAPDESKSFFQQALRALIRTKAKTESVNIDMSKYSLICIGTPVWAFGPAPAMNTFLSQCAGLAGKEGIVFTTYGSGAGNSHCIKYIKNILVKKGVKNCSNFTIEGKKTGNTSYVKSIIDSHN
jgi:flavodoxin